MDQEKNCLLCWNDHGPHILRGFYEFLQTETFTNVTLGTGDGHLVKCHQAILAACSTFFQQLFKKHENDDGADHPIVMLDDILYSELKGVLEYMYKGEVNVSVGQLSGLFKAARTLMVKGLDQAEHQLNIIEDNGAKDDNQKNWVQPKVKVISSQSLPPSLLGRPCSNLITTSQSRQYGYTNRSVEPIPKPIPIPISVLRAVLQHTPSSLHNSESQPKYSLSTNNLVSSSTNGPHFGHFNFMMEDQLPIGRSDGDQIQKSDAFFGLNAHGLEINKQCSGVNFTFTKPSRKSEMRRYKQYSNDDLEAAMTDVQAGMTPVQAARKYKLPTRTVYERVRKLRIQEQNARTLLLASGGGNGRLQVYHPIPKALGLNSEIQEKRLDVTVSGYGGLSLHGTQADMDNSGKMDSDPVSSSSSINQ